MITNILEYITRSVSPVHNFKTLSLPLSIVIHFILMGCQISLAKHLLKVGKISKNQIFELHFNLLHNGFQFRICSS